MGREALPGGPPESLTRQRAEIVVFACGDPAHAEHDSVAIAACKGLPPDMLERIDLKLTGPMRAEYLRDLSAGLVGGMGMAPSADVGDRHAVFQPAHGSAPDIAGRGIANPTAMILSVAMLLEWLDHPATTRGAAWIRRSVERVLSDPGQRTPDVGGSLTTADLADAVLRALAEGVE